MAEYDIYISASPITVEVSAAQATAGGSSTFASLTDKATADLPTINTPLATALGLLAPKGSPTFTGTVTIPSGASIAGYLTTAAAASTYQPLGSYAPSTGIAPSAITGTAVITTDPRLSDARTPTTHDHDDLYPPRLSTITVGGTIPAFTLPLVEVDGGGSDGKREWLSSEGSLQYATLGDSWRLVINDGLSDLYVATFLLAATDEPWKLTSWTVSVGSGQPTFTIDPPALQPVGTTGTTALSPNQDGSLTAVDVVAVAATGGTMTNGTITGTVTFGAGGQSGMFAALGTGTPSNSTFLRGDGTWAAAGGFSGTANRITVAGTADSNLESAIGTTGTNSTVNVVSLAVPSAVGTTNVALLLTPKGTGAIIAGPMPDGTATGGNARGARAVDFQTLRASAGQVASGASATMLAGEYSTASGANSLAGQYNNVASGAYSLALGYRSTASGEGAVAMGGSFTGGYGTNLASGQNAVAIGGGGALADRLNMRAFCGGNFAGVYTSTGDAQQADFVLRCKTTTNAAVEMALNGSTTYLTVPSGKVIAMRIQICGIKSDGSAVAHYMRQYAVKNVGGTTSEVYAPVTLGTDNAVGTTIALTANNASDYVSIQVTGIAAEIWRWTAHVQAVEIAYGT